VRQRTPIVPDMFDDLTFKPACDHPSVVRYSTSGGIKAATPARLVAEITSPTFVDYDLLSDFFLTFRGFLDTTDLLYMLIARLKWALTRDDETGTVVRVRTFVALRHWILNYFLDDFVIDYDLRRSFCQLLNNFVDELALDGVRTKVPLKILGELKKCWRRVCALYWDSPQFDTELSSDIPIVPGGIAGSRNPQLDPAFWAMYPEGPPTLDGIIQPDFLQDPSAVEHPNFFADVARVGHIESVLEPTTLSNMMAPITHEEPPLSPSSIVSEDFVSCSFPSRLRGAGTSQPLGAHPVQTSSTHDAGPPIAITPKALTGKRVRPTHTHKRSASFSDSYRDQRAQDAPVHKFIFKSTELLLTLPYAGSLVRGNLFPPGQAYVDAIAPSTPAEVTNTTNVLPGLSNIHKGPSAMSGPGMKKLLGSMRRALSTRNGQGAHSSPTQGSIPLMPSVGVRGAAISRPPGLDVIPQARSRHPSGKTPQRIDILVAEAAEDFKRAVKEDADAEEHRDAEEHEQASDRSTEQEPDLHYSIMDPDTTMEPSRLGSRRMPLSEMTNGSKSIVIVDDTLPLNLPIMTGALPMNVSTDGFQDPYMHRAGGPTPPSTPPEGALGTPRRSSNLLGQHVRSISHSFEQTPSLIVDSRPSRDEERSPSHRPAGRFAMRSPHELSFKSTKSTSLRRRASLQSGFTRRRSELSFDATTYSDSECVERLSHIASVPLPLRVLRRRPGGDLRAVSNVGDLNAHSLRRPMSTGSLTTYSESIRSLSLLNQDANDYASVGESEDGPVKKQPATFSLGQMAAPNPKPVSLFSTHSSQPVMRPSFEKEAQLLAQIPDDDDDDGGVESALLKLEGKFEQRRSDVSAGSTSRDALQHNSFGAAVVDIRSLTFNDLEDQQKHRPKHVAEGISKAPPPIATYQPLQRQQPQDEDLKPMAYQPRGMRPPPETTAPRSGESYNSLPLLDRVLTDEGNDSNNNQTSSHNSTLLDQRTEKYPNLQTPESSHVNSFDFVDETESMKRIPRGDTRPSIDQSYLDSDSDRSDLSSELSLEIISRNEYMEQGSITAGASLPIRADTVVKEIVLPSHPLCQPPSPPITLEQALKLGPDDPNERQPYSPLPPTPEITPTAAFSGTFGGERGASPTMDPLGAHRVNEPSRKTSVHLPFILAFDSQILAQQLTLIEKDALNEIDWKDLIEMKWKDASTEARSWVEFLRTQEPRGVEVVIARFNIMVKWAVSECVLTQDLGERVRCFIKFIHIAAHCRRYRNFATMTQLTVALTSKDLSRLTGTWSHVPEVDLQTLRELEALVTPTHNFYNLRAEMEGAGAGQGCIPFVGIYTHDLLVNSERPSQVASTPTTDPLVNFERCRTDATIVKNLLRLLEASQLYKFFPIEGITERCLWMASLSDEEIAKYGKMIQE
jgi:hypothetical protein